VAVAGRLGVGRPASVVLLLLRLLGDALLRDNELLPDELLVELLVELLPSATLLDARVLRDNQLLRAGGMLQSRRCEAARADTAAKRQLASRRFPSDHIGAGRKCWQTDWGGSFSAAPVLWQAYLE
jgi:hypothetical protein